MTTKLADPTFVLDLESLDSSMIRLVGGKAANLGELIGAGLPVPPGFCVTTEAYEMVAAQSDLTQVCDALATISPSDSESLTSKARRARELVAAAPMPPELAQGLAAAYEALKDGSGESVAVAVRSSATAEDLPTASFAGQQDTYLNVVGTGAVLEAVHRCWASLWTDRAVVYRAVNGIDQATVQLAVVVQRMVDASVAGVLFTADPVTGRRHRAVVDSSPGLGEAVVSGAVNPDRFVVDAQTRRIVERRLADKAVAVRSRPGGGTENVVTDDGTASLSDTQLLRLVALGARVESHFGAPQDIEWAVDERAAIWLTQARPITTLFPLPAVTGMADDGSPVRVYFCFSLAQGLHRPITPMGLSALRVLASGVSDLAGVPVPDPVRGPGAVTEAAGRAFLDVTGVIRNPVGRVVFPRVLDVMEARSAVVVRQLLEDPRLARRPGGRARLARRLARVAIRYRVLLVALEAVTRPAAARRRITVLEADLKRLARPLVDEATSDERLEAVTRLLCRDVVPMLPRIGPAAATGFAMLGLARRLLGPDARPGDLQQVLRGLPHNVTTEMDLALWQLASQIRADPEAATAVRDGDVADLAAGYRAGTLPPVAQRGLAGFLGRYGHRAVAEIDIGMPRWRDDPSHLLGVLANYLRLPDGAPEPASEFRRGATEAEAMITTLQGRASGRSRARGVAVGFALRRTRQLAGLRETPKNLMVLAVAGARAELARIGQDLASTGRVAAAEDVFFLDLVEVRAALDGTDLRALVRARRESYHQELRRRRIPRLLLSDGTEPEEATTPSADGALHGTPASAGTVTAPARVILDPADGHLVAGEILVAPSTDPGWTPLFLTAGGLVMEMGGANSHGAVVAREYGIPAVVGVPDATNLITNGQRVHLDGSSGVVTPVIDQ